MTVTIELTPTLKRASWRWPRRKGSGCPQYVQHVLDSNTLTLTGTDGSSVAFGAGRTVLYGNQSITLSGDCTGSGATRSQLHARR